MKLTYPYDFGRYQLLRRLAVGGMAEIFLARTGLAEKEVVIKRMLPQFGSDPDLLKMFVTEAKLVCQLQHPNIVQVHELGEHRGQYFIAMEYVRGMDAWQLWRTLGGRGQRLPVPLCLFVVAEILKGLDCAHRSRDAAGQLLGVVHRDVSLSNILISNLGEVKVSDFGVAMVKQENKTLTGVLKGKLGYMSPEQVAGLRPDLRSDIFAAGVVLAELLTGRRLFLAGTVFETLSRVMKADLRALEAHSAGLPPAVLAMARRALSRQPAERYPSAHAFEQELRELIFQEDRPVTREMLAAFLKDHVTPYLVSVDETNTFTPPPSAAPEADSEASSSLPPLEAAPTDEQDPDEAGIPTAPLQEPAELTGSPSLPALEAAPTDEQDPDEDLATVPAPLQPEELQALQVGSLEPQPLALPGEGQEDRLPPAEYRVGEVGIEQLEDLEALGTAPPRARSSADPVPELQLSLRQRSLVNLLVALHADQESGLLLIRRWPEESALAQFHVSAGQPHLCAADWSEEELLAYLIRMGALTRGAVSGALARFKGRRPLAAVMAAGAIGPLQVARQLAAFVCERTLEAFLWSEGELVFLRHRTPTGTFFPTGLETGQLLSRGVAGMAEAQLDAFLARLPAGTIAAAARPPIPLPRFRPSHVLIELHASLAPPRSTRDLIASCASHPAPRQAKQALYLLLEAGLVEWRDWE